jgi:hypothetical protein
LSQPTLKKVLGRPKPKGQSAETFGFIKDAVDSPESALYNLFMIFAA